MTAVSQLLPNFIQGINEQPDELKKPGQVRDAVNVYPDITKGLLKRTGYELIGSVVDNALPYPPADGTWFYVTRREGTEKKRYLFNVSTTGFVRGWDVDDGTVQTVNVANDVVDLGAGDEAFDSLETVGMGAIDYLSSDTDLFNLNPDYAIKTATIADTTFLCNSFKEIKMNSSKDPKRPYEAFIEFKVIDTERAYKINFDRVGNEANTFTQVVKLNGGTTIKFESGGNYGDDHNTARCNAAKFHTLTSPSSASNGKYPTSTDNGSRTPIQLRVEIKTVPKITKKSDQLHCQYSAADPVILSGGQDWQVGDKFTVNIPGTHGKDEVTMRIEYAVTEVLTTSGAVDVANISVAPSASNNSLLSLQERLCNEIYSRINSFDSSFSRDNIEIIGNGIYISDKLPFKIDTSEPDLLNIITNQSEFDENWEEKRDAEKAALLEEDPNTVFNDTTHPIVTYQYPNPVAVLNNVSNLPLACKPGFVAKVANSFTEDDDYFVEFVRDYNDTKTTKPTLAPTTNIVNLQRYTISETDGSFDWSTVGGSNLSTSSTVGTEFVAITNSTLTGTNKVTVVTTFVESGMGYWKEIAKPGELAVLNEATLPQVLRYRTNTDDWVLAKVHYANRTCGTEDQFTPSFVNQTINNILFYRNRLVFLSGSSVVTSNAGDFTNFFPSTALVVSPSDPVDIEATSNYTANLFSGIQINNALLIFGEHNQFLLTTDSDIFSPNTAKLSQVSSYKFDINSEPFSIGTNIGFVGNSESLSQMYEMTNIFREGQTDVIEKSKLISSSFTSDYSMTSSSKDTGLITFGKKGSDIIWLYKYFKENSQSDIQQAWFKWQLPSEVAFQFLEGNYHYAVTEDGKLYRNDLESSSRYQDGSNDYEMKIVLPTFYVTKNEQSSYRADTTSSLVIHRIHLNTGNTNYYTINIDRFGKDSYNVEYEQSIQDAYETGDVPITIDREQTVPLYEKNTNLDITISSEFNGPFTLYSLRWEGDYNSRYYQRV